MENIKIKNIKFENQSKKDVSTFKHSTITYLCLLIAFVGVRIFASLGFFSVFGDSADFVASCLIQIIIMLGISVFVYKLLEHKTLKQVFEDFSFKKISLTATLIAICIGIVVFFLNSGISAFFYSIISLFGYERLPTTTTTDYSIWGFVVSLFTTALLPGFCEEVAHRGLLLNGLKKLGMKKAILISGLLFGLMHLNIEQFFYATLIGFLLGFICLSTRSIFPCMIIHFMNNGISVYLSYASENNWLFGNYSTTVSEFLTSGNYFSTMFTIFIAICLGIFVLIWLVYLLIKSTTLKTLSEVGTELHKTLETEQNIKTDMIKVEIPFTKLGFNINQTYFPKPTDKIYLVSALFLGILITTFTFIWGII